VLGGQHGEHDPALGARERPLGNDRAAVLDADHADQIDAHPHQPGPNIVPTLPEQAPTREVLMQMVIECECGWSLQGPEDALVEATRQHAREAHGMDLTREQVLAAATPAETG
jgi:predicted small metal-binding protein